MVWRVTLNMIWLNLINNLFMSQQKLNYPLGKYGSERLCVFLYSYKTAGTLSTFWFQLCSLYCISPHINLYDYFSLHRRWIGLRIGTKLCSNRSTRFTKQVSLDQNTLNSRNVPLFYVIWSSDIMSGIGHACKCVSLCLCMSIIVKSKKKKNLRAITH